MLRFLKKIFGFPTDEEIKIAKAHPVVVHDIDPPVINNKTGDVVIPAQLKLNSVVADQITDSVTQAETPVKKTRKPRTPKIETPAKQKAVKEKAVKEKAAKPVKAAAIKVPVKRLKKV